MRKKTLTLFVLFFVGTTYALPGLFGGGEEGQNAEKAAKAAANTLGWPSDVTVKDGEQGAKMFTITPGGDTEDPKIQGAVIVVPSEDAALNFINILQENGFTRSTYQGRDAVMTHKGEQICNPGGQAGMMLGFVKMFLGPLILAINPNADLNEICAEGYGTIAWRCGKYVFFAQDQTDGASEYEIANAIYAAGEKENLCGLGDTIVILAQSNDVAGGKKLSEYQTIAQELNSYYSRNAYGKASFTFTFKDADGSAGSNDWYTVNQPRANFQGAVHNFGIEAAKVAFTGSDLPEDVYVDRIIVVYAGNGKQHDGVSPLYTCAPQMGANYVLEVQGVSHNTRIHVPTFALVSEYDYVGNWAHEVGHTLHSKYQEQGLTNLADRYAAQGGGEINYWGLMAAGAWGGNPAGTSPPHMSGYTKEAAGWLRYTQAQLNKSYTETAIENKKATDTILQLDDPESANAGDYYIIEARDAGVAYYDPPATGVVVYKVSKIANGNAVNVLQPQSGAATTSENSRVRYGDAAGNEAYNNIAAVHTNPTLSAASREYKSVPGKFKIVLEGSSSSPYTATVKVEEYRPARLRGARLRPGAGGLPQNAFVNNAPFIGPLPDIDLHAYDDSGNHVGVNYNTMQYEVQIPGAISSGDLRGAEEWIFVPEGANVRYEVSSRKTKMFISNYPSLASEVQPEEFTQKLVKIDASGNFLEADGESGSLTPGKEETLKSPYDSGLNYGTPGYAGFGKNSAGICCLPFVALLALGAFAAGKTLLQN